MIAKILVVDDDRLIRGLLKDFLRFLGYEVLCLESAKDALPQIEAESFDIIITDYDMPGMDGLELTRSIKQIKPSVPIIGISASCNERRFIDAGANHFVSKPFDLQRLKEAVENNVKPRPAIL
jgi:CheY-like chemotaxis protein